jgi:hypothetical protein
VKDKSEFHEKRVIYPGKPSSEEKTEKPLRYIHIACFGFSLQLWSIEITEFGFKSIIHTLYLRLSGAPKDIESVSAEPESSDVENHNYLG